MCDCFDRVNIDLMSRGISLKPKFYLPTMKAIKDGSAKRVSIEVVNMRDVKVDSPIEPNFCPFCGERYVKLG